MVCRLPKLESGRQFAVKCISPPNLIRKKVKCFPSTLCIETMSSFREIQLSNGFFPRLDTMQLPIPPPTSLPHKVVDWVIIFFRKAHKAVHFSQHAVLIKYPLGW